MARRVHEQGCCFLAHASCSSTTSLLRFIAPAPCGTFLACIWPGMQVLIEALWMYGGRLSTKCMVATMALFEFIFRLVSDFFWVQIVSNCINCVKLYFCCCCCSGVLADSRCLVQLAVEGRRTLCAYISITSVWILHFPLRRGSLRGSADTLSI